MLKLHRVAPIAVLTGVLACAGCAVIHPGTAENVRPEVLQQDEGWVLLEDVPFVPQQTDEDCGAAALSMVLAHWGVDAPAEKIHKECAVPGTAGLKATDLREAAKRRGLSAYLIEGNLGDLEHELERGRPVVVGLVKTAKPYQVAHYEVVVGLRKPDQVAALDPARGLVCDSLPAFTAEWAATKGTTLVIFRPEPEGEPEPHDAAAAGP